MINFELAFFIGAPDGDRTRTGISAQGILSPSCLPIPTPELPRDKDSKNIFFYYLCRMIHKTIEFKKETKWDF